MIPAAPRCRFSDRIESFLGPFRSVWRAGKYSVRIYKLVLRRGLTEHAMIVFEIGLTVDRTAPGEPEGGSSK